MPPSRRAVRSAGWLLWPAAALVTLGVVGDASYAAFIAQTSNAGNSFSAGSVVLTDNDANVALMGLSNLKPTSSGSRCINVTSSGTLPSSVKLYVTDLTTTKSFSSYVNLVVTLGSGSTSTGCSNFVAATSGSSVYSGTLASFGTTATGYSTGVGSWTPTGSATETRSYRFAYTVDAATPDSAQGGTANFGLTWETQNA